MTKPIFAWALYDFANSAWALASTLLLPVYFRLVILGNHPWADLIWGGTLAAAFLGAGILAPLIGSAADAIGWKRRFFVSSSCLTIAGIALFFAVPSGAIAMGSVLVFLIELGYGISLSLYDSFLPHIAEPARFGRVSGFAWGLGYLGSLATIAILVPFARGFETSPAFSRFAFLLVAGWYLAFSLPSFWRLPASLPIAAASRTTQAPRWGLMLRQAASDVLITIRRWRERQDTFRFLLSFYLVNDGLTTVFYFTSLFVTITLGLPLFQALLLFAVVQLVGVPSSFAAGWLADRFGQKRIFAFSILGWIIAVLAVLAVKDFQSLAIVAGVIGLVIGATQAIGRSLLARLTALGESGKIFGFNAFATKLSSVLGPFFFGLVSSATGSQRLAVLTVIPFFLAGLILLRWVREPVRVRGQPQRDVGAAVPTG